MEPKTIKIDNVEYVRADSVQEKIVQTGDVGVVGSAIGQNVICRTRNEGVLCGTVAAADKTGVVLDNVRRLWFHKPAKGAWFEGASLHGLHPDSKVSATVSRKWVIGEAYTLLPVTPTAYASIMSKTPVKG